MSGVLKVAAKIGTVLALSIGLGYAEYRIKGGKPIRQLYADVQNERLEMVKEILEKSKGVPIEAEGTVK